MMFTQCDRRGDRSQLQLRLQLSSVNGIAQYRTN